MADLIAESRRAAAAGAGAGTVAHLDPADVELSHVHKSFGDFEASRDVGFKVEAGTLAALLGPSGSGKTTILRMIAGLALPDSGEVRIGGQVVNDVPASKRGVGLVFQNYALFRYMTVRENIAFGLKVHKAPAKQVRERVDELLELIDLKDLGKRYPGQLSGGQRQRVAFARALAPRPRVLLLDEPFAAIDAKIRKELRAWLKQTIREIGITSIFVTHDQEEAIEVADQVVLTHAGRVEQVGTPQEIYQRPRTEFAARFFGESAVVDDYRLFKTFPGPDGVLAPGEKGAAAGQAAPARAIIRPEHVEVAGLGEDFRHAASASRGTVRQVTFLGSSVEVEVEVNGSLLKATRSPEAPALEPGQEVQIFVYRLFSVGADGSVAPVQNSALREETVVI